MRHRPRVLAVVLMLIFVLSGAAGLIYESIWTGYLGNLLGHAAYAQTLVLAIFMGGMAAGAAITARPRWQQRDALLGYAAIEAAIGVLGLAFHSVFLAVSAWLFEQVLPAMTSDSGVQALKWGVAALLILPQSILLGMTFPLMSTGYIRRLPQHDGRALAGLYFSNSFGAAVGVLVATFVLVPRLALPGTLRTAAGLNLAVALVAFVAAWRWPEPDPALAAERRAAARPRGEVAAAGGALAGVDALQLVLIAAAITGATSLVYEIGWIRMLNMALGSSVHSFELMLAAFIGGLAFGGLAVRRRIDQVRQPLAAAGVAQVLMGLAALASLPLYEHTFDAMGWLMAVLSREPAAYPWFNLGSAAIAIAIMMPAAFFAGMTLPLFTLALLRGGHGEASVGRVYAVNTIGAIVGVLGVVHLLVPLLGVRLSVLAAGALDIALGIYLLHWSRGSGFRSGWMVAAAAGLVGVGAVVLMKPPSPERISSGVYRSGANVLAAQRKTVFLRDGKTATASFTVAPSGIGVIATNGKPDAAIMLRDDGQATGDESTMSLLALLPLAAHPAPKRVGIIGLGSGLSTHTVLGDPRVESVDTIEIEPAMMDAARGFGPLVERAFSDPRSHLRIEDARTWFANQRAHYDVIISEPSNPWVNGVANLFSREFYATVPRHLNPDGLFVQWVQMYELDNALLASILSAMEPSFPRVEVYSTDADLIVIASPDPKRDLSLSQDILATIAPGAVKSRLHLDRTADLAACWLMDASTWFPVARTLAPRTNSEYDPVVAYTAPEARFLRRSVDGLAWANRSVVAAPLWISKRRLPTAADLTPGSAGCESAYVIVGSEELANALVHPEQRRYTVVPADLRDLVDRLVGLAARCDIDADRERFEAGLSKLATSVVSTASAPAQTALWTASPLAACVAKDADLHRRLDLYHAIGLRDGARVAELATAVLERPDAHEEPGYRSVAVQALLAASLERTTAAQRAALVQKYLGGIPPEASDRITLLSLIAQPDPPARTPAP